MGSNKKLGRVTTKSTTFIWLSSSESDEEGEDIRVIYQKVKHRRPRLHSSGSKEAPEVGNRCDPKKNLTVDPNPMENHKEILQEKEIKLENLEELSCLQFNVCPLSNNLPGPGKISKNDVQFNESILNEKLNILPDPSKSDVVHGGLIGPRRSCRTRRSNYFGSSRISRKLENLYRKKRKTKLKKSKCEAIRSSPFKIRKRNPNLLYRFTPGQIAVLRGSFNKQQNPDRFERERLSDFTGLTITQINTWFCYNRSVYRKRCLRERFREEVDFTHSIDDNIERDKKMPVLVPVVPLTVTTGKINLPEPIINQNGEKSDGLKPSSKRLRQSRKKQKMTEVEESVLLEWSFKNNNTIPVPVEKHHLSKITGLSVDAITKWFETKSKTIPLVSVEDHLEYEDDMEKHVLQTISCFRQKPVPDLKSAWSELLNCFLRLMELYTEDALSNLQLLKDSKYIMELHDCYDFSFSDDQTSVIQFLNSNLVEKNRKEIWDMVDEDETEEFVSEILNPWSTILLYGKVAQKSVKQVVLELARGEEKLIDHCWTIPSILDGIISSRMN